LSSEVDTKRRVSDRTIVIGLVALVVLLAIPYAVLGPKFILDDWFTIYWRSARGLLRTSDQMRSRPGAWLVFVVEFGLIGRHPLVIYLVQVVLTALSAVLLFYVARRFIDTHLAGALAAIWVILPNHSALEHWASTMGIQASLVLLLLGALLLIRATDAEHLPLAAVACFVASALCYEATLPASALALFVVPRVLGRRLRLRTLALEVLPLVLAAAWMYRHSQHNVTGWFSFGGIYPAHFGLALAPTRPLGQLLGVGAAALLALALAAPFAPSLRWLGTTGPRLVLVGLAIIVVGTLPFARYAIDPIALGDRANVVSSIGSATAWLGIIVMLWSRRVLALAVLAVLVGLCLAEHLQRDHDYALAGRDAARILTAVGQRFPVTPDGAIVVGPGPIYHHGVIGLIGPVNQAARAYLHRPGLKVYVVQKPQEFLQTPPDLRVTIARS
jgi:hypothetical protein